MILSHLLLCITTWSSAFLQLFEHQSGYWILGTKSTPPYILRLEFLPPACSQFHRFTFAQRPVTISLSAHFFVNSCLRGPIWAHSDRKVGMASNVILDLIIAEQARKTAGNFLSQLLISLYATKSNCQKQTHLKPFQHISKSLVRFSKIRYFSDKVVAINAPYNSFTWKQQYSGKITRLQMLF